MAVVPYYQCDFLALIEIIIFTATSPEFSFNLFTKMEKNIKNDMMWVNLKRNAAMLKKIAFTMYPVADINRARNFYEKTLGLTMSKASSGGAWIEYDLPGGGCFAITTLAEGVKPSSNSGGTVAFEVDDLDGLVSQLKSSGVKFKLETFSTPVCRIAVILDSEGNSVTLHQLNKKQ